MAVVQDCRYFLPPVTANSDSAPLASAEIDRLRKTSFSPEMSCRAARRVPLQPHLDHAAWCGVTARFDLFAKVRGRMHAGVQESFPYRSCQKSSDSRRVSIFGPDLPSLFGACPRTVVPYTFLQTSLRFIVRASNTVSGDLPW